MPSQVPIVTGDQPVYAIGKQVQWLYPSEYGEDKLLLMMGPLHIEIAFLNATGDWLKAVVGLKSSLNLRLIHLEEPTLC